MGMTIFQRLALIGYAAAVTYISTLAVGAAPSRMVWFNLLAATLICGALYLAGWPRKK
jgi:hypothetical protein